LSWLQRNWQTDCAIDEMRNRRDALRSCALGNLDAAASIEGNPRIPISCRLTHRSSDFMASYFSAASAHVQLSVIVTIGSPEASEIDT
jgi:hypothetical protein